MDVVILNLNLLKLNLLILNEVVMFKFFRYYFPPKRFKVKKVASGTWNVVDSEGIQTTKSFHVKSTAKQNAWSKNAMHGVSMCAQLSQQKDA